MKVNRSLTGKRIISALLVFAMILSFIPITTANAAEMTYEVFSANVATY